ncbi:unnamed protein product [Plutella xylostella]|uniref:(diamondback moth) hypothetical protein n=1 Tax=Plutella xylostella TaxID=51655 RepID=A0A8S4FBK2_PLUXY|nr:unnamed protein product [Plutella xylostella]
MEAVQAIAAIDMVENLPRRRIKLYNARADPFSLPDVEFRSPYRFQKDTMNYIIDLVRDDIVVDQRGCGTTPELQVVCDATLQIMDFVARWRGSTHDSRIFTESSIKQRFERREFRGRLLGDSGYRLEPYLFTPITRPQNVAEEHYNFDAEEQLHHPALPEEDAHIEGGHRAINNAFLRAFVARHFNN